VKTVTLEVRDPKGAMAAFSKAWRTGKPVRSANQLRYT